MGRARESIALVLFTLAAITTLKLTGQTEKPAGGAAVIPKTWDDQAIATIETPLANPIGSPQHVSAAYYYRIPVAPIYKSYPVYTPSHEPAEYLDWLKQQEPQIIWDDAGHGPPLKTQADWIRAGEIVFDAPVRSAVMSLQDVRNPTWYEKTGMPTANDGSLPIVRYVIKQKGVVELAQFSCGTCHIRLMPDGSIVKGAQGNFPLARPNALALREAAQTADASRLLNPLRVTFRAISAVPWLNPDPAARLEQMSIEEVVKVLEALPPGVNPRHRASPIYPVQIPDLIGVKDRRYLDRTGLQSNRSIGDLMRYDAMNRGVLDGGDGVANHNGFIPGDPPRFQKLPDPATRNRYSDEQLYALALYIYSLQPPPNPNKFDAVAAHGQRVFEREGCAGCHTPPLYTNNKLTPADGFTIPEDHRKKYDILPVSVGTDTNLTLKTRRGTGYYKVPSLKGLWYRGMFPHDGSCATLEDWFDPRRLKDDYLPTGFKGAGVTTRAVKGHEFGLRLSAADKKALLAFLRTL
jgi:hypothetical protein